MGVCFIVHVQHAGINSTRKDRRSIKRQAPSLLVVELLRAPVAPMIWVRPRASRPQTASPAYRVTSSEHNGEKGTENMADMEERTCATVVNRCATFVQ